MRKKWYIPDMYWPSDTNGPCYVSHESICALNTSSKDCWIRITLYYEDKDPVKLGKYCCKANRTLHIRMDEAKSRKGEPIATGVPYAAVVLCDNDKTVIQYTRVDTSQPALALMTTMAHRI